LHKPSFKRRNVARLAVRGNAMANACVRQMGKRLRQGLAIFTKIQKRVPTSTSRPPMSCSAASAPCTSFVTCFRPAPSGM
jgi:hypothetical protein